MEGNESPMVQRLNELASVMGHEGNPASNDLYASATRIEYLEDALRKCIATFDDLGRVLRLLGRQTLADACAVAADSSRDALTPSTSSSEPK